MSTANSTLSQQLADRGFTHRKPDNTNHQGRVIVNGCGTAIGRLTSSEAWEWVRVGCPLDVNGFIDAEAIADAALERGAK